MRLWLSSFLLLVVCRPVTLAGTGVGTVTAIERKEAIFLEAGGAKRGLSTGTIIGNGDSIKTRTGRIEIRLAPGSFLWVAPQSLLVAKRKGAKTVLYLRQGKLALQLSDAGSSSIEISMEYGRIRARGRAVFFLNRLQGSAILDVREGITEARNAGASRLASASARLILKRRTIIETAPPIATQRGELRSEFMAWVGKRRAAPLRQY